jgi:SAM-dependent methyltransferase
MDTVQSYFEANKASWNQRTAVHQASAFYGLDQWRKDTQASSLTAIETRELGDWSGLSILHLQCHFGQDTISFARTGARRVVGCDMAPAAISLARELAAEQPQFDTQFVECNVYDLPEHLNEQFDMVFTSYGTIGWLPDLTRWAQVIAHFVKPGGRFYMADFHPVVWMFDDDFTRLTYPYNNSKVIVTESTGTYTDRDAPIKATEYNWNHSISDVLNALLGAGLRLRFFNEHMYSPYDCFPNMVQIADRQYQLSGLEGIVPMVFSLDVEMPL